MYSVTRRTGGAAILVASVAAVFGAGYGLGSSAAAQPSRSPPAALAHSAVQAAPPSFESIVARYGPAVVNVRVSGTQKTGVQTWSWPFPNLGPDDPFSQFFRRFEQETPRVVPTHGIGSGFILSPDGLILTNAHVVAGANEVTVELTDKREFRAKILGVDKPTDIAVLKINAHGLPTVKIGDSAQAHVGDWVLAIGSPFGLSNTVTAGIISAKSRSLPQQGYVRFIQTDVPINPGSSGSPLFALDGSVIGINSQIYGGTGAYEGVSFSIPIDTAMQIERQLLAHGKIDRGYLGITIQDVSQPLAQDFGLQQPTGALISSVQPDGAGARAGLRPGDVILKLNEHNISDSADLPPLVASLKPGERATLSIWRNGRTRDVDVQVGNGAASTEVASALGSSGRHLGLSVRPLTPEERSQANVASGGLMVESSTGPAAQAGIEPGDIILSLNDRPVASTEQLQRLLAKSGHHVALLVQHGDERGFVSIDLG